MTLPARDHYISPPRLGASGDEQAPVTTVVDIATPVVDAQGECLGVLLFTLDWSRPTSTLPHALEESPGEALLVDAEGCWLVPGRDGPGQRFGQSLATHSPDAWRAMSARHQGMATLDEHLLAFRSHKIGRAHV